MLSLLLVEDDPLLGQGLCMGLQQRDHMVEWVTDGLAARRSVRTGRYDCILLDLQLPGMDGMQLLNEWRKSGSTVPVLIITARDGVDERIAGLDQGADDYIVKPFSVDELAARVRAVYRRKGGSAVSVLKHGLIELDPVGHSATCEGAELNLSVTEFKLLQTLLEHGKRVSTREFLEKILYGNDAVSASNTVEVHIHSLRKKIGKETIKTVRGVGYILS